MSSLDYLTITNNFLNLGMSDAIARRCCCSGVPVITGCCLTTTEFIPMFNCSVVNLAGCQCSNVVLHTLITNYTADTYFTGCNIRHYTQNRELNLIMRCPGPISNDPTTLLLATGYVTADRISRAGIGCPITNITHVTGTGYILSGVQTLLGSMSFAGFFRGCATEYFRLLSEAYLISNDIDHVWWQAPFIGCGIFTANGNTCNGECHRTIVQAPPNPTLQHDIYWSGDNHCSGATLDFLYTLLQDGVLRSREQGSLTFTIKGLVACRS